MRRKCDAISVCLSFEYRSSDSKCQLSTSCMAAHFADGGGGSTFATFVKISPAYTMHKDLGCSGKNGTSYESGGVGACATLCDNDSSCENRRSPENEEECRAAVVAAGLEEGGCGPWDFAGAYGPGSGCFTFLSGTYASCGYWSTSGNPTGELGGSHERVCLSDSISAEVANGQLVYKHRGHCADGWMDGNTLVADLNTCAARCRDRASSGCGYIAFASTKTSGTNCNLYRRDANLPRRR